MPFPIPTYNIETEEHVEPTMAIPQAGGFFIQNIKRNKREVYSVVIL